ncbi:hypothetical protein FJU30_25440 [Affinibrenneria salicis]|uniref:Uncharacterized protein n=1 Tax=Affinibrenneria salicis TaxID=2590031 RepID=A0A5J5FRL9_9GAMM|nr:hypothetical protein FJU30_25440 [Affinibrenneria salicis]
MWINLCVTGYKAAFCCGMQQSAIFLQNTCCGLSGSPYNALPLTRQQRLRSCTVSKKSGNNYLTSQRKSILFAARATVNVAALLFNN